MACKALLTSPSDQISNIFFGLMQAYDKVISIVRMFVPFLFHKVSKPLAFQSEKWQILSFYTIPTLAPSFNNSFVTKHLLLLQGPCVCAMLLCRRIWIKNQEVMNSIKYNLDFYHNAIMLMFRQPNYWITTCLFSWQEGRRPANSRTWFKMSKKVLTLHPWEMQLLTLLLREMKVLTLHPSFNTAATREEAFFEEVFQNKENLLEALNAPTSPARNSPHLLQSMWDVYFSMVMPIFPCWHIYLYFSCENNRLLLWLWMKYTDYRWKLG